MKKAGILAAGDGTRLKAISPFKPITKVLNTPLLELTLQNLHFKNFEKIALIFNDDELAMDLTLLPSLTNLNINYFFKSTPSSMHSLFEISQKLNLNAGEHFFVSMVDSIIKPIDAKNFHQFCHTLKSDESGLIVTSFIEDEKPLTLKINSKDYITEFQCPIEPGTLITSGVYYLSSDVLPLLTDMIADGHTKMRNFLTELVKKGHKIKVFKINKTLDIDRPEDITSAEEFLREESLNIPWILFDFGGCLDSDGVHSRKLFLEQFIKFDLVKNQSNYSIFQEAYSYSDKKVINESLILDANLLLMNEKMCFYIAEFLNINDQSTISKVASAITDVQAYYLKRNKLILEKLVPHYKLGIISNFSGNLKKILEEFELSPYFNFVLDSYHVGFSKPDPRIFELAIKTCGVSSKDICFIGDNIDRDILPAKKVGMKTILISSNLAESQADYNLSSLEDLLMLTQNK